MELSLRLLVIALGIIILFVFFIILTGQWSQQTTGVIGNIFGFMNNLWGK